MVVFCPFARLCFMTAVMENSIIAQNTCLQFCVIGRNSFVGAGTTFTDFNLVPKPLRAYFEGELQPIGTDVMGGCVGHNCRLGAGLSHYAGPHHRVGHDSDCLTERHVITKNVTYEESDHHKWPGGTELHPRLYDPNVRPL